MSDRSVTVVFTVANPETFKEWLQFVTDDASGFIKANTPGEPLGYRADDTLQRRDTLARFADRMETVLRQHDHKTSWRTRPIPALVQLLKLELAEFDVAFEFFEISEIRKELVDLANYSMIVDDRLSLLEQNKTMNGQPSATPPRPTP